jgi:hypothetical protein
MSLLTELCDYPISRRDLSWEKSLSRGFLESEVFLVEDQPFQGPDGFSYMHISSEKGSPVEKDDFLTWCFESGMGLVLNLKDKKAPDYVFNYGMVWNYLLRGKFINEVPKMKEEGDDLYVHKIEEGYLPKDVRKVIKSFLEMNKIDDVKISLVSGGDGTPYELMWLFPKLKVENETDKTSLLEAIAWFLPLDYRLAWADSEDTELKFQKL